MAQIVAHEDGVYMNLRHADHIADWAPGGGGLKLLKDRPPEWWYESPFNTILAPEPAARAPHFERGEAAHVLILFGEDEYNAVYGVEPDALSHPNHIGGGAALQQACREYQLKASGTIDELVDRLRRDAPTVQLLADVRDEFARSGKMRVTRSDDTRIRLLHRMAMRSSEELLLPDGSHTLADLLRGGLPEVSVFWTETYGDVQMRHRARFDMLKPNITLDLKTIADWRKGNFKKALLREAVIKGYVLQAVQYEVGRQKLREFVHDGRVFGATPEQMDKLLEIAEADEWAWGWIFAKTTGFPEVRAIPITNKENAQFVKARQQRDEAIANFVLYHEFHGGLQPGGIWFDPDVIWEPEDSDWPETYEDD